MAQEFMTAFLALAIVLAGFGAIAAPFLAIALRRSRKERRLLAIAVELASHDYNRLRPPDMALDNAGRWRDQAEAAINHKMGAAEYLRLTEKMK